MEMKRKWVADSSLFAKKEWRAGGYLGSAEMSKQLSPHLVPNRGAKGPHLDLNAAGNY